jgi:hypothetical protein
MIYTSSLSVNFLSNKTGSMRTTRILDWSMFRFLLYSKPKLEQKALMIKKCTDSCSLNLYRFQRNLFSSDAYFLQNIVRLISTILMLHRTLISTSEQRKYHIRYQGKNSRHAMYISAKIILFRKNWCRPTQQCLVRSPPNAGMILKQKVLFA